MTAFTFPTAVPFRSISPPPPSRLTRRRAARACAPPLRAGVLVSGGGRSLENICTRISDGRLRGLSVAVVISSRGAAGGVARAHRLDLPTRVVRPIDYERDAARHSAAVCDVLDEFGVQVVVLAGWLHFFLIPDRYTHRVLNIHPSLIPAFCGKDFFGNRVHQAAIDFGAKVTGCTVHFVDNHYDNGPIVIQRAVEVREADDADALAARVFEAEMEALPAALQLFADGRLVVEGEGQRVRVLDSAPVLGGAHPKDAKRG